MRRIHAFISGNVQGVFYRAHTMCEARKLDLNGWVRNLRDGRVEVVAEGEDKSIEKFIEFLHKGSPESDVKAVKIEEEEFKEEFDDFFIRHTR